MSVDLEIYKVEWRKESQDCGERRFIALLPIHGEIIGKWYRVVTKELRITWTRIDTIPSSMEHDAWFYLLVEPEEEYLCTNLRMLHRRLTAKMHYEQIELKRPLQPIISLLELALEQIHTTELLPSHMRAELLPALDRQQVIDRFVVNTTRIVMG